MATPVTTASDFCTLLVKSKLLPAAEVESLYQKWKEEKPGSDTRVDSFRRYLVATCLVTEYQATLVQRGRPEGFFLDGYKILDQIGKGQMGGVYKAVHTFGQVVALKILPASKAKNTHILGRFQREARLLTQINHPNVVRAFQVGECGGVYYIVMEYLEGETLDQVLERRKRLSLTESSRLMRQILDGLQHLHEQRMVHRDMKPANMMLTPGMEKGKPDTTQHATIKILDIGLGRELFDDDAPEGQIETQLTQEGSVLGTPDYLAPEQAKDARSADIRADIYSVGCVLYHCLTGQPPFPEPNIMAQMLKHATEKPAPLVTLLTGVPSGFQQVIDRFLAKSPESRYQTPAEAAEALKPFVSAGAPVLPAKMVPAYKDWLASESGMEIPKALQQTLAKSTPSATNPAPAKPGTAPKPSLSGNAKPAAKPGTAPKPALKSEPLPPPNKPGTAVKPIPVPVPYPAAPPVEEVEVELVTEPVNEVAPGVMPSPMPTDRPLWSPDRRDWLMLATGAVGVLSAVGLGYGLARLLRRKDSEE